MLSVLIVCPCLQVLNQVNLGSPRPSANLESILQDPEEGQDRGTPARETPDAAVGPFAAAAAAGGRSRLNQETR